MFNFEQVGKPDEGEKSHCLAELSRLRKDTDQQFGEVQHKLRPLPDEVGSNVLTLIG